MLKVITLLLSILVISSPSFAEEQITSEQIKGLDEQVQEIKSDVLSIAAELKELEERLLYPSHTQVAIFVSLAEKEKFVIHSVGISIDENEVANHLYTYKELEALRKGGVQRIFTGNITTGEHEMLVTLIGKSPGGADLQKTERFTISKEMNPKIIEIILASHSIIIKDR